MALPSIGLGCLRLSWVLLGWVGWVGFCWAVLDWMELDCVVLVVLAGLGWVALYQLRWLYWVVLH